MYIALALAGLRRFAPVLRPPPIKKSPVACLYARTHPFIRSKRNEKRGTCVSMLVGTSFYAPRTSI